MSSEYLVEVKDLKQYFPIRTGFMKTTLLKAVDGVNFGIKPGETLGLVGESGCGKTTVGRTLLRLYKPTGGEIYYDGELITDQNMIKYRPKMQMVFQDPYSSLDPRMTVEEIIGEPLDVHKLYSNSKERREKILGLMELVGLNAEHATRYVHEFSGGQRQRIGIARALAVDPRFIVCDEAVSALDVSIQAQVINMFEEPRLRSSTCLKNFRRNWASRTSLSRTTFWSSGIFLTVSRSCIWEELWRQLTRMNSMTARSTLIHSPCSPRFRSRIPISRRVPRGSYSREMFPVRSVCLPDALSGPDAVSRQKSARRSARR